MAARTAVGVGPAACLARMRGDRGRGNPLSVAYLARPAASGDRAGRSPKPRLAPPASKSVSGQRSWGLHGSNYGLLWSRVVSPDWAENQVVNPNRSWRVNASTRLSVVLAFDNFCRRGPFDWLSASSSQATVDGSA